MKVSDSSPYFTCYMAGLKLEFPIAPPFFFHFTFRSDLGTQDSVGGNCCTVGKLSPDIQCRHYSSSGSTCETADSPDLKYDTLRRSSGVSITCPVCGTCIKQHKPLSQVNGFIFINILPEIRNELLELTFWSSWFSRLVLNGDPILYKVGFCSYDSKRLKKCCSSMHEIDLKLMVI